MYRSRYWFIFSYFFLILYVSAGCIRVYRDSRHHPSFIYDGEHPTVGISIQPGTVAPTHPHGGSHTLNQQRIPSPRFPIPPRLSKLSLRSGGWGMVAGGERLRLTDARGDWRRRRHVVRQASAARRGGGGGSTATATPPKRSVASRASSPNPTSHYGADLPRRCHRSRNGLRATNLS